MKTQQAWSGTTAGSTWMHRTLIGLLRFVDVRVVYVVTALFVVPVCLFTALGRNAYRYFRRRHRMGRLRAAGWTVANNFMFAQVVVDRFAQYAGRTFRIDVEGYGHYLSCKDTAYVQLSAHVGAYEMAGYRFTATGQPFNALVFGGEAASVMEGRDRLFARRHIRMIPVREDGSHVFDISSALSRGEIVSLPADRRWGSDKTVTATLLGAPARFPAGPFALAAMRGLDVLAVNVVKTAWNTYTVSVTPLAYDKTLPRREAVRSLVEKYAAVLDDVVRRHPAQWYNYFDFWDEREKKMRPKP